MTVHYNKKFSVNKYFFTLFVSLSSFLVLTGCGGDSNENQSQRPGGFRGWDTGGNGRVTSVETMTIERSLIADQVRSFGTVQAQDVVAITPQVSNRITRLYVDLGDEVKRGQLLAKIYDATFRDQLNQARAQLSQTEINLERDSTQLARQKRLLEIEAVSQSEYDIALSNYRGSLAQYESAVALLTQAQENFNNTEVRSPVNGVVNSRNLAEGDIATSGQSIFEIANTTGYESRIFLPVQDWRDIRVGQEVSLRVSSEAEPTAKGVVSRKSPQLDPTTGLGEVVISLSEIGASIYPGVLTENIINITVKPRAITVPRSAMVEKVETVIEPESNTIQLERTYSVFVSNGDSVAELRQLELGIEQGDRIEVLNGLRAGDQIVVTGQQGLRDGSRIRVSSGTGFSTPQQGEIATGEGRPSGQQGGWESRGQGQRPGGGNAALANLSEKERTKIRQRMQNMSREERRALMDSIRTANSANN